MEQLNLLFGINPISLLKPTTDPEYIEEILDDWENAQALESFLDSLKDDLRDITCRPVRSEFEDHMASSLKDCIRVVARRIRELHGEVMPGLGFPSPLSSNAIAS
jgi:hypothetical protein